MMYFIRNVLVWAKERYRFKKPSDVAWSLLGLALGTTAAYFPWHVYSHQAEFPPPRMAFSGERGEGSRKTLQSIGIGRPGIGTSVASGEMILVAPVDAMTTGTVKSTFGGELAPQQFASQGLMIIGTYRTGILLRGQDGIDFVPYGGWVPGSGRIEKIEHTGEGLVAVTSSGERISTKPDRLSQATDK